MHFLAAVLHTLGFRARDQLAETREEGERGEISIQWILVALASVVIAGIVIAAITNYVTARSAELGGP